MSMIEFRSVCKDYQGRRVIDALSLKIEANERVVLFGPSGCGKSTILHLIAGPIAPDEGHILINDELVATAKNSLREPAQRGVGMVFQDLALWPHMTVHENIEFGLEAKRIPKNKRNQRVREMVDLVGLGHYLNARPGELSGGQQQRVALARTLIVLPPIVLLDEPLSNLDDALNMQLRGEIVRLHGALGFTLDSAPGSYFLGTAESIPRPMGTRRPRDAAACQLLARLGPSVMSAIRALWDKWT
jgi:ABC-type sugar transport system ATPase subunit